MKEEVRYDSRLKGRRALVRFLAVGIPAFLVACFLFVWGFNRPNQSDFLSDGSRLFIHSLQSGREVHAHDGGLIRHLFRAIIPENGIHLGPVNIKRPVVQRLSGIRGEEILYLELDAVGKNGVPSALATPSIYGEHRGVFVDGAGMVYPQRFHDTNRARRGDFGMFICSSYPRTSESLVFHVQQRRWRDSPWETLTTLRFKNPVPVAKLNWGGVSEVRSVEFRGWTFSIGEVVVRSSPIGSQGFLGPVVKLPLSVSHNQRLSSVWTVNRILLEDQTGSITFHNVRGRSTEESILLVEEAVPDPSLMWKVKVVFKRRPLDVSIHGLVITIPPISSEPRVYDFAGYPVTIERVTPSQVRITTPIRGSDLAVKIRGFLSSGRTIFRSSRSFRSSREPGEADTVSQIVLVPKLDTISSRLELRIEETPAVTFFIRPQFFRTVSAP